MNNPQVICIEQDGRTDGQQGRKNGQGNPLQQDGQRTAPDRSRGQSRTGVRPGEGVWTWTPGGMDRARDSRRCGTVAKIASPTGYRNLPSQKKCISSTTMAHRGTEITTWLCGELLHAHLLSADIRRTSCLIKIHQGRRHRVQPSSVPPTEPFLFLMKGMKAAWR